MTTFNDIKELVSALNREAKLIAEVFSKRTSISYKYSDALELVEYDESRLDYLIDREVLRETNGIVELDDLYVEFFEHVLGASEEINLSSIDENIRNIKENVLYFLKETNETRKYGYLRVIKKFFRKIGFVTVKSVIELRNMVDYTFKNEVNYSIKKLKLENLDKKRDLIRKLISQTQLLIDEEEVTFFNKAMDDELNRIISELKHQLNEVSHNLIEIEKQIIDYLNQIKIHSEFSDKLRKLKYLKDHFIIEAESNIRQVLSLKSDVIFERRVAEPLNLSLDLLRTDEDTFEIIKRLSKNFKNREIVKIEVADAISSEFLESNIEEDIMINYEEIRNRFMATSDNLFNFIYNYDFYKEVDFYERVTVFCQIISLYENELEIKNEFQSANGVEYAMVYSK